MPNTTPFSIEQIEIVRENSTLDNWKDREELATMLELTPEQVTYIRIRKMTCYKRCKYCNNPFPFGGSNRRGNRNSKQGPREQLFCSQECHAAWMKNNATSREKRICRECGNEFECRPSEKKRFCSDKCHDAWSFRRKFEVSKRNTLERRIRKWKHRSKLWGKCLYCKKQFTKTVSDQKYCSRGCLDAAKRETSRRGICKHCHKEFWYKGSRERNYCSQKCYGLAISQIGKDQVNINGTSRALATFVLTLREDNPEAYYGVYKKLREEMGYEWIMSLARNLSKFHVKIRGKTMRSGELRAYDGSRFSWDTTPPKPKLNREVYMKEYNKNHQIKRAQIYPLAIFVQPQTALAIPRRGVQSFPKNCSYLIEGKIKRGNKIFGRDIDGKIHLIQSLFVKELGVTIASSYALLDTGIIVHLYVQEDKRRQGIGSELLRRMEICIREHFDGAIGILVSSDEGETTSFYTNLCFYETEKQMMGYKVWGNLFS